MPVILGSSARRGKVHSGPPAPGFSGLLSLLPALLLVSPTPSSAAPIPVGLSHRFIRWTETAPLSPTWVRVNLHWGYFQPVAQPDTAQWDWDNDETHQMDSLVTRGYSALAVLRTGSVWANRGTAAVPYEGPSYPPSDLTDTWDPVTGYSPSYHRLVETLVRHYNGDGVRRIPILVVENEVTSGAWWQGLEADDDDADIAGQYLRLLKTAYHAAKAADPGIIVADSGIPSLAFGAFMVQDLMDAADPPDSILAFANRFNARCFNITWGWPFYWPTYDALATDFAGDLAPLIQEARVRADVVFAGLRPSHSSDPDEANVDWFNFHFYEPYWELQPMLEHIRARFGGDAPPLMTNEMGTRITDDPPGSVPGPGPDRVSYYAAWGGNDLDDGEEPGIELIEKIIVALAAGVSPVAWFILDGDGDRIHGSDLLEMSLFHNDAAAGYPVFRRRPIYYAFSFLAEHLRSGGGHERPLRDTCLGESVYRYALRDQVSGALDLEVLWWDDGSWREFGLPARGFARVLLMPPAGATALDIHQDYLHPGESSTVPVTPGIPVELAATDRPVILRWRGALEPVAEGTPPQCGELSSGLEPPPSTGYDYGFQDFTVGPNPTRDEVSLRFHLGQRTHVRACVFDVHGREQRIVLDAPIGPGFESVVWDGRDAGGEPVPAGLYVVRAEFSEDEPHASGASPPAELARKILLLR